MFASSLLKTGLLSPAQSASVGTEHDVNVYVFPVKPSAARFSTGSPSGPPGPYGAILHFQPRKASPYGPAPHPSHSKPQSNTVTKTAVRISKTIVSPPEVTSPWRFP